VIDAFAEGMMRRFLFVAALPGHARLLLIARRLLAVTVLGGAIAVPAVWLAVGVDFDAMAGTGVLLLLAGWGLAMLAIWLVFSRASPFVRRLLVVGAGPDDAAAARLVAALRMRHRDSFQVISVLPAGEAVRLTPQVLWERNVWGIIVTDAARKCLAPDQLTGRRRRHGAGCRLFGESEFWESRLRRVDIDRPADALPPAANAGAAPRLPVQSALDAAFCRAGDILLSLALLLFTLPLMLLTALLIRFDSPGPVFYRQQRVGLRGRLFTLFKFRSMCVNAEARGPVWAASRDPRVTRVGTVIRLTRIDELPQLVNVLRGEMSLIGPRPERPHFVRQLADAIPLYSERAAVRPGLTGWAQINYPYGASVEDARVKLSYDLYYVKHRSVKLAVLILFSTVGVVLFRKGAR